MCLPTEKLTGFTAAIADGGGIVAAEGGGNGVDAKATLAGEFLVFGNLLEGREHQQFAGDAGVEVGPAGLEVGAETPRHDCDEREARRTNGAGHGLLARRNATRDDDATAIGEKERFGDLRVDFGLRGAARDLNEKLVGQFSEKSVADGVAGWGKSGEGRRAERAWQDPRVRAWQNPSGRAWQDPRGCGWRAPGGLGRALAERTQRPEVDRSRDLEEIGVLHDGPATLGVAQDIAGHALELAFAEENRIVETRKPEGRRAVDDMGRGQGEIGFRAGDLEASDDFAERRSEGLVHPDDAVEMLGHDRVLAGLDFREDRAEVLPRFSHRAAERRGLKTTVANLAQNRSTAFYRERDHVEPRLAVIPTRQTDAGLEVAVLVALAKVGGVHGLRGSWPAVFCLGLPDSSKGIPCTTTHFFRKQVIAVVMLRPMSSKSSSTSALSSLSTRMVTADVIDFASFVRISANIVLKDVAMVNGRAVLWRRPRLLGYASRRERRVRGE